jgi:ribosomal protein S7
MNRRLQDELLLAQKKQGESVKKKIAIHRTACSHRAFTHYRWF